MWKLLPTILLLLIVAYTDVQAETTSVTTVTCVDTSNSPETGDITTVCTTTVVTTVTTPESTTTTTSISENLTDTGDILSNSTFGTSGSTYSGTDWTIENNTGAHNGAGSTGGSQTGGVVASGHETNISQTVTSVKTATGMSEAEVLYKFGPSDHETIRSDRLDFILSKTWFYIPIKSSTDKWITEIKFDSNGRLIKRDRYRVK